MTGSTPATPQEFCQAGKDAFGEGEYAAAAELFQKASDLYASQSAPLDAAEMRNNRAVALLKAGQNTTAWEALRGSDEIFAQAGDLRRQGMALGNMGSALEALKRNEEALLAYSRSADLLKQAGENELRANVLRSISALQMKTGKQLEALASMDAALSNEKRPSLKDRLLHKLLKIPFKMMNR
ncbi:MAG TPA: hypothetical protein VHO48_15965 [Anaerolineaceae bacterium]|nr:hypothetical protein [Anaerolineaceae bacterium]